MTVQLADLALLDHLDLATWVKPTVVDQDRGNMMVAAAVAAITDAVFPKTELPDSAKFVVLEVAKRGYLPRVQQESLGSRSVSFFAPTDPREGIFLTEDELRQLGVAALPAGAIWTRAANGAGGVVKAPDGKYPWSSDTVWDIPTGRRGREFPA